MIETSLYTLLSTSPPIAALINTRIYPVTIPEDPILPCLDYRIISAVSEPTFLTRGTLRYRIEINCWGETYGSAVTLRAAVKNAIDGYYDGRITIQSLSIRDDFDHELLQYRATVEFYIYGR